MKSDDALGRAAAGVDCERVVVSDDNIHVWLPGLNYVMPSRYVIDEGNGRSFLCRIVAYDWGGEALCSTCLERPYNIAVSFDGHQRHFCNECYHESLMNAEGLYTLAPCPLPTPAASPASGTGG